MLRIIQIQLKLLEADEAKLNTIPEYPGLSMGSMSEHRTVLNEASLQKLLQKQNGHLKKKIATLKTIRLYPVAMVCCFLPGLMHHTLLIANVTADMIIALAYLHILTSAFQGLAGLLIYMSTPAVREQFESLFNCRCCIQLE